jgi:S1-C subfamily serine protease
MESLTKQQMVLLTLLVSFVTSLATGIVTVSLLDQSSGSVSNTIERVIDNTVSQTLPSGGTAAAGDAASSEGSLALASASVAKSIVRIHSYESPDEVSGLGIIVNSRGTVMTDKAAIAGLADDALTYSDGEQYRAAVVQSQVNGDLVFLDPIIPTTAATSTHFMAATLGVFPRLGDLALSLGGDNAGILGVGVIDQLVSDQTSAPVSAISSTIASSKVFLGSPLFDITGAVSGIRTSTLVSATGTEFYPIALVRSALPH